MSGDWLSASASGAGSAAAAAVPQRGPAQDLAEPVGGDVQQGQSEMAPSRLAWLALC